MLLVDDTSDSQKGIACANETGKRCDKPRVRIPRSMIARFIKTQKENTIVRFNALHCIALRALVYLVGGGELFIFHEILFIFHQATVEWIPNWYRQALGAQHFIATVSFLRRLLNLLCKVPALVLCVQPCVPADTRDWSGQPAILSVCAVVTTVIITTIACVVAGCDRTRGGIVFFLYPAAPVPAAVSVYFCCLYLYRRGV